MQRIGASSGLLVIPRLVVILATLIAGVAVGIGATSVIATHDANTIHACVNNQSGNVRIVPDDLSCRGGETALQWNQVGPEGPQGPQGPAGEAGQDGADGVSGLEKHFEEFTIPAGGIRTNFASCTDGRVAIGGGYQADPAFLTVSDSFPGGVTTQWGVTVRNTSAEDHSMRIYIVCALAS